MTDEEIVKRAKEAEKRTGFGELVHSPISKGVNSAYGIGFIEGMVEYRNSLQEEPVSEGLEKAAVEAFKQIVDSNKNNFLEIFKAGAKWQLAKIKSITLDDLGEFINELSKQFPEVSFAKVCKIATRTAKWLLDVELPNMEED